MACNTAGQTFKKKMHHLHEIQRYLILLIKYKNKTIPSGESGHAVTRQKC